MIEEKIKQNNKKMATKFKLDNKINEMKLPFCCYDIAFKAVFTNEENILAKMVADITGMDYKILKNNITLETTDLPISSINEKAKRCDFIIRIDKSNILNIELNSSYYTGMIIKNLAYLCQIFSGETKSGNKYNKNLNVMQLNLNCFTKDNDNQSKNSNKEILNEYQLQNVKTHEIYTKNISILTLDIVKCYETYYNLGNKETIPNYIKWGTLIYNRNFEEIPDIVKGIITDKERDRIMDKMAKLSRNSLFMSELEALEWAEWEKNSIEADAIERGLAKGMAQGMAQGIAQGIAQGLAQGITKGRAEGIEQNTIDMIRTMFKNNLDLEMISKISNKSIDEIKQIINNQD